MGRNYYIPTDVEKAYLAAAGGDQDIAKELMLETLDDHAPEGDDA